MINLELAEKQGLTEEDISAIKAAYQILFGVLEHPEKYDNPVSLIEEIEYTLQDMWKFEKDRTKHSYWYKIKGCTCPVLDNKDRWGVDQRVISVDCKWHRDN